MTRIPLPRNRRRRATAGRALATALVTAMSLAGPSLIAGAEGPSRLGLTPITQDGAYFDLTLAAGERREMEVEAANFGEATVLARTYRSDVYSIINGGFGADLYGNPAAGATSWVDYPTQEMELSAREAVTIAFTVTVPTGTPPGQYVAALVIENVEPLPGSGPIALDQVNRQAIAVAIDVPGQRTPELVLGAVASRTVVGHSIVSVEVANAGNVHLEPDGTLRLLASGGAEVASTPVSMDAVYAGTATLLEVPFAPAVAAAAQCIELELTDRATGAHDEIDCAPLTAPPAPVEPAGPGGMPGTSAVLAATPSTVLIVAGTASIALALVLAARRRATEDRSRGRASLGRSARRGNLPEAQP